VLTFFQCVAEAVAEKGIRELVEMVPGGGYAYHVATAVWEKYRRRKRDAEQRAEIQRLAQLSFDEARKEGMEAARQAIPSAPVQTGVAEERPPQ
jgi:hypothetical protein